MMFLPAAIEFVAGCSKAKLDQRQMSREQASQSITDGTSGSALCIQAARRELGPNGIVLKCEDLIGDKGLEAVVAVRVPGLKDNTLGVPVSALKILRRRGSGWDSQLNVDQEATNNAGYIGADFIDNSYPFPYHWANFTDRGAKWGDRSSSQFTLVLFSMNYRGKVGPDDVGLGIGWNPAVGRFQELEPNGDDFVSEVKVPKHARIQ